MIRSSIDSYRRADVLVRFARAADHTGDPVRWAPCRDSACRKRSWSSARRGCLPFQPQALRHPIQGATFPPLRALRSLWFIVQDPAPWPSVIFVPLCLTDPLGLPAPGLNTENTEARRTTERPRLRRVMDGEVAAETGLPAAVRRDRYIGMILGNPVHAGLETAANSQPGKSSLWISLAALRNTRRKTVKSLGSYEVTTCKTRGV